MKAALVSVMPLVTVSSAGADPVLTPDSGVRSSLALDGTLTLAAGISFFGSQSFRDPDLEPEA